MSIFNKDPSKELMKAAKSGNLEAVKTAIAKGADINSSIKKNRITSLIYAAWEGHLEIVKELIANGAVVNLSNKYGSTPLHYAVEYSHLEILKELIKNKAIVDPKTSAGFTPLMYAVTNNDAEITKYLLDNGANALAEDCHGWTVMRTAQIYKHHKTIQILKEHLKKPDGIKKETPAKKIEETTEVWNKMGNDCISYIDTYPEQRERLTQIFNFSTRQQLIKSENLKTKEKLAYPPVSFRDLDKKVIEKAVLEFEKQGGKIDKDFVFYGNNTLNKKNLKKFK